MLITEAGDEHSLVVTEDVIAVYFYGIMPPGGRFGYLYSGIDPDFVEWQKRFLQTGADSPGGGPNVIDQPKSGVHHGALNTTASSTRICFGKRGRSICCVPKIQTAGI
jgi:hypothetical protein